MKTRVMPHACRGHAICQSIAPEVFLFDDDTERAFVEDEEVPEALKELVRQAALACPEQAIVVSED